MAHDNSSERRKTNRKEATQFNLYLNMAPDA